MVERAHRTIRPRHSLLGIRMYSSRTRIRMSLTHPYPLSSTQVRYTMRDTTWP